ncbi:hypothetical protein D3C72_1889710 [compost metagenome]
MAGMRLAVSASGVSINSTTLQPLHLPISSFITLALSSAIWYSESVKISTLALPPDCTTAYWAAMRATSLESEVTL